MNTLDTQYQDLLQDILENGVEKGDRTGTGTISTFGRQIRHNLNDGFPLLTTKKMAIKSIMTELKWFLKGRTDIQYLRDNGCKIWDGDFEKAGKEDGTLGPIYGKQWRDWNGNDQIKNLIDQLKINPDSRRLMVSAWNVGELEDMTLPPCHYGFQLYTRVLDLDERIDWYNKNSEPSHQSRDYFHEHMDDYAVPRRVVSLMWNQRSVDTFLGLPFNIASYAMLLHLIAKEVDMIPGEIIGNLGDTHLYKNHIEQAEEQISREPKPHLPKLKLSNVDILNGEFDYEILHYHSHPTIKAPLSN
jgi:thymidylate synthase